MAIINMIGGGAGLNFSVKAYASYESMMADTPKNGTVGVVAPSINSYSVRSAVPETATENDVCILTGSSSNVPMVITNRNPVVLYPRRVKVFGTAWENATARVYVNGWKKLETPLYTIGTEDVAWTAGTNVTKNADSMTVGKTNGGNGLIYTDAIDVTDIETLYITYSANNIGSGSSFGLSSNTSGAVPNLASVNLTTTGSTTTNKTVSVNVSGITGNARVKLYVNNSGYSNGIVYLREVYGI